MRRVAALAGAIALAGCGGSSGPHLSEAQYKRQSEAICVRYQADIARLGQPAKLTQLGPYIARALPVLARTAADLGRIHPPSAREDAFGKFLALERDTVTRAKALRAAAARADGPGVQRLLKEASAASGQRADAARAAGLDACALS